MTRLAHTASPDAHYQPADRDTQQEVGGILERAFQREDGHEPYEAEITRFVGAAEEAEARAEAAEALQRESERAGDEVAERYALTAGPDDLAAVEHHRTEAESYRRESEMLHQEAERLRKHIPG